MEFGRAVSGIWRQRPGSECALCAGTVVLIMLVICCYLHKYLVK